MVLYSSLDRSSVWRSERVGRGFDSTTLFGRGVASRTTSSTTGVASCGVASFGVAALVDVLRRFASRVRPEARRFSAISVAGSVLGVFRSGHVDMSPSCIHVVWIVYSCRVCRDCRFHHPEMTKSRTPIGCQGHPIFNHFCQSTSLLSQRTPRCIE